jgi:hypothetical protein
MIPSKVFHVSEMLSVFFTSEIVNKIQPVMCSLLTTAEDLDQSLIQVS